MGIDSFTIGHGFATNMKRNWLYYNNITSYVSHHFIKTKAIVLHYTLNKIFEQWIPSLSILFDIPVAVSAILKYICAQKAELETWYHKRVAVSFAKFSQICGL